MGWDKIIGLVISLVSVITSGAVAIVVALIVSGRDDQRQREAERRAVQRETIIALQDGWFAMDAKLTNVRHLIQHHQSVGREIKAKAFADEAPSTSFEEHWEQTKTDSKRLTESGNEMNKAVLDIRSFMRWIELLESRVTAGPVKDASNVMRIGIEATILDVANRNEQDYTAIRAAQYRLAYEQYEPAYKQFINAGYAVLADIDREEEHGSKRRWGPRWRLERFRRESRHPAKPPSASP